MNLKAYIESGILECYILKLTNAKQSDEVELYARIFPEVLEELGKIEAALETLANVYGINPPPEVKKKVLDYIKEKRKQ